MKKLLSIIVPVYNKELFLESCVESINNLNINKEAIEAIFVDDCSSDQSLEIIEEFVAKYNFIKLIKLNENTGCLNSTSSYSLACFTREIALGLYVKYLLSSTFLNFGFIVDMNSALNPCLLRFIVVFALGKFILTFTNL